MSIASFVRKPLENTRASEKEGKFFLRWGCFTVLDSKLFRFRSNVCQQRHAPFGASRSETYASAKTNCRRLSECLNALSSIIGTGNCWDAYESMLAQGDNALAMTRLSPGSKLCALLEQTWSAAMKQKKLFRRFRRNVMRKAVLSRQSWCLATRHFGTNVSEETSD